MSTEYAIPTQLPSEYAKEIRHRLGMTQKEFAGILGCSKPTVERWEKKGNMITGPAVLLLCMIGQYPGYIESMKIPEKAFPLRLKYMHRDTLCTIIDVDELRQKVYVRNYAENILFRAFGQNETPSWEEYQNFLESRCFPRSRDKMKLVLEELDLPFYDPLLIVEKTEGRMAEDDFRVIVEH